MTVIDLVAKLKANDYRVDAIARIVGYIVLIQGIGWDELNLSRTARHNLQKIFRTLGIDPQDVKV
jgi:hypothetical protein